MSARLRAVVAFDHDDVAGRMRRAQLDRRLIFRGIVAGERRLVVPELEHDVARADLALGIFELAATHQELRAVFLERYGVRRDVVLVPIRIAYIDVRDPVTLRHAHAPSRTPESSSAKADDPVNTALAISYLSSDTGCP